MEALRVLKRRLSDVVLQRYQPTFNRWRNTSLLD